MFTRRQMRKVLNKNVGFTTFLFNKKPTFLYWHLHPVIEDSVQGLKCIQCGERGCMTKHY